MSHYPPKNSWQACQFCGRHVHQTQWGTTFRCPFCQRYQRLTAAQRIKLTVDADSWQAWPDIRPNSQATFPGYAAKLAQNQSKTGLSEALKTGQARIGNQPLALAVMDSHFMMGTLSQTLTKQLLAAFDQATQDHLPLVLFTASGGARMQEGLNALFGMNQLLHARAIFQKTKLPLITVLTDPTMGGVSASIAFEADVVLAEEQAQIGFAGKRVIEQTSSVKLPADFQNAQQLAKHGQIDQVLARDEIRDQLKLLLRLFANQGGAQERE